ncbi:hypothetical protein SAURM35S_07406 [Streptomyces aurantiogriseus]|uniref:Bacterial alpha-L-rhamnosidase N-terminal domain-containing protein n=1 Tax=Streptomyces aurantiogriseus TaxID=66870 RepID=A0A918KZC6_9ACTN|nr:alpha-L-rhamnosidase N-terminal domain-containing protein [Streptomyces aurantiogriseus]GGR52038.1 hypothetical protein GCM10010251_81400 [Streptomyces aurantiogriseus]
MTDWSRPASWAMGLLERGDWGAAEWIEYPGRDVGDPLPVFARALGTLAAPAAAGAAALKVSSVTGYHVGGTINIDTGDGGERLESRTITAIGTAGPDGTGIGFEPPLSAAHAAAAEVTGSGNSLASTDPSAGPPPRVIARLEITRADGSTESIVSDRTWRAALGAVTTADWYAGSDYDSRREQPPVIAAASPRTRGRLVRSSAISNGSV